MRTIYLIILAVVFQQGYLYSQKTKPEKYAFLVNDYLNISRWNSGTNQWGDYTRQLYKYDVDFRIQRITTISSVTGDSLSRSIFYYNSDGRITEQLLQNWSQAAWTDAYKYITEYDLLGRKISVTTLSWSGGIWINAARQYNLTYDSNDKLLSYESQYISGNDWVTTFIDYYEYDLAGDLVYQIRKDINGVNSYQAFYTYSNHKMMTRHVQSWQNATNVWTDTYRDTYQYNSCGKRTQYIRERFNGTIWVNEQKTEYIYRVAYFPGDTNIKVPVCHSGRTFYIKLSELSLHLAHGDCIGECEVTAPLVKAGNNLSSSTLTASPFTVYPNPANEKITLKFNNNVICLEDVVIIELTDFYGKPVRSYTVSGGDELTIYRNGLISGKYYLRLLGKETFTAIVVFK